MQDLPCDLRRWLPEDLLAEVFELSYGFHSPAATTSHTQRVASPTKSPQIAPLGSRLHNYKLAKPGAEIRAAEPIRLFPLFRQVDFEAEVSTSVRKTESEMWLFDCLVREGVFTEAVQAIRVFQQKVPSLRADASIFTPTGKENTPPNS